MQQINFFLKDRRSEAPTLIYLFLTYNGKGIKKSTGLKIAPCEWKRKLKRSTNGELNNRLHMIEQQVGELLRKALTHNSLIHEIEQIIKGKTEVKKMSFTEFSKIFIEDVRKQISYEYYISLKSTLNHIQSYRDEYGDFDWDDIDILFYRRFRGVLRDKKLTKNTVAKHILNLKRILNEATELGHNTSTAYKSKNFKADKENVYNIYLSIEELNKMWEAKMPQPYLDRTRDKFLIGCFTGMRFSDYNRLSGVNFMEDDFIVQDMKKVSGRVIIPQHPIVREIIKKYNGGLPPAISNQKMNKYIKEVGEIAKIDGDVYKTRTVGNEKKTKVFKKYELITTHTARRSLATNMYLAGVPIITIMKITGHSSPEMLMKYIKITELEVANSLASHPFFT